LTVLKKEEIEEKYAKHKIINPPAHGNNKMLQLSNGKSKP
jgi:hypothetical protein